jgi:hypothetical protein
MHDARRKKAAIPGADPRSLLADLDIGFTFQHPADLLHERMSMTNGARTGFDRAVQKLDLPCANSLRADQSSVGRACMVRRMICWYVV